MALDDWIVRHPWKALTLAWISGAVISIGVLLGGTEEAQKRPVVSEQDAYTVCQNLVLARISTPATTQWQPAASEESTRRTGRDSFEVRSYFDAQNTFGALVRYRYACMVHLDSTGRQWVSDLVEVEPW